MKPKLSILIACFLFLLTSCGYHNSNIYSGPERTIYLSNWSNKTNKLSLNADLYRSLNLWFQKSQAIKVVSDRSSADLVLAGEIVSVSLPSLSYTDSTASEVRVILTTRYVLKDITNNKILMEAANSKWTEEYNTSNGSTSTSKEDIALDEIVDDLSKDIYQKTLKLLKN